MESFVLLRLKLHSRLPTPLLRIIYPVTLHKYNDRNTNKYNDLDLPDFLILGLAGLFAYLLFVIGLLLLQRHRDRISERDKRTQAKDEDDECFHNISRDTCTFFVDPW